MEIVFLILLVMLGAAVQGVCGMGFGLVSVPILVWVFGPIDGIVMGNLCGLVVSASIAVLQREHIQWSVVAKIIIGSLPAIFLTIVLLRATPTNILQLALGILMLAMVFFSVFALKLPAVKGTVPMLVTGFLGGAMSAAVAQSGPVMAAYAQASRWSQKSFSATIQPYFVTINILIVPIKYVLGLSSPLTAKMGWEIMLLLLAVVLGLAFASIMRKFVSANQARNIAIMIAIVGAINVIVRAIAHF